MIICGSGKGLLHGLVPDIRAISFALDPKFDPVLICNDINSLIAYAAFCVRRNQWV